MVFVGTCAYLAAVYWSARQRRGDHRLQGYFTRRVQCAAIVTGALSLATLAELHSSDPALFSRLTGRALALVIVAGLCDLAVLALLTASRHTAPGLSPRLAWPLRSGMGCGEYPMLLPGTAVTLSNAGAPDATLVKLVGLFAAVVVLIGPSFALLFSLQGRRLLPAGQGGHWRLPTRRRGRSP